MKVTPVGVINPECQLTTVAWSPCGRLMVAPGFDGKIHRWRSADAHGENAKDFAWPEWTPVEGHHGFATGTVFHPRRTLAFSSDSWGRLQAWPYLSPSQEPIWSLDGAHDGWIRAIDLGGDGEWLASAGRDGVVRLHATVDGSLMGELRGHDEDVYALAVHPSGPSIVTADMRGRVIQWDPMNGRIEREFQADDFFLLHRLQDIGGLRRLRFSTDGSKLLAIGGIPTGGGNVRGRATVRLWSFESGEVWHDIELGEDGKDVFAHDAILLDSGELVAVTTGQPGQGKLIVTVPGREEPLFQLSKGTVNCHGLALSPEDRRLAVIATNSGSNGNGRKLDKEGNYPNNHSPVHVFDCS